MSSECQAVSCLSLDCTVNILKGKAESAQDQARSQVPGVDREQSGHGGQENWIMRIPVALQCPEESFPLFQ